VVDDGARRDPRPDRPLVRGNARVKEARRLSRRSVRTGRRLFLVEGWKAIEGALGVEGCLVEVFATREALDRYEALLADARSVAPVREVEERTLASLSDAVSPQGVVGVCRFVDHDLAAVLASPGTPGLVAVAADVRDPGNAGTLLRTADAAGATGVVLAGDAVDGYNPKTVRATVGSLFRVPWARHPDPEQVVSACRAAGYRVLAADGAGETDLFDADDLLSGPTAWLFGNEAWGLPDRVADRADHRVRIPVVGGAESLNLSTAAAVCLYASARVRRAAG
jgi:TrmH family RNA methyltransferase